MRHKLKINISKKHQNDDILTYRQVTMRERLLRLLLGASVKLAIIVPGDTVEEVAITKIGESEAEST